MATLQVHQFILFPPITLLHLKLKIRQSSVFIIKKHSHTAFNLNCNKNDNIHNLDILFRDLNLTCILEY